MFVPVVVALPTSLVRVKTAATFTAADPWNSDRVTGFTVDDYLLALRGTKSLPKSAHDPRWAGGFHRALHSESGAVRMLPESLVELWLTEQVPIELLPRLLKAIEPTVKRSDYRPILRNSFLKAMAMVETFLCIAMEVIVIVGVTLGHAPLLVAVGLVLGVAAVGWAFLYLFYYGRISRRRRQMRWLLGQQAESASAATTPAQTHPQSQIQAQSKAQAQLQTEPQRQTKPLLEAATQAPPLAQEPLLPDALDDVLLLNRDVKLGPPTPPVAPPVVPPVRPSVPLNGFTAGFTFDSVLRVPDPMEPRMVSRLKEKIPELQWEDLAENWGKIRIMGTVRETFQRLTVSISRKESPGPFNLRIRVCTALQSEAEAFYKAMINRLWLALLASTTGSVTISDNLADTPHPPPFIPPFFSSESRFYVPEGLESGMALRIKDAVPELTWLDQARDWEEVRILATSSDPKQRIIVSIDRGDAAEPFQLWIHTTASPYPIAHQALTSLLDRIRAVTHAIPPDVTFESQITILELQVPMLEATLRERIPELEWRTHTENDGLKNANKIHITGTVPDLPPRILVSLTGDAPLGTFKISVHVRIAFRGCFEAQAQAFHQAMLQRLQFSLCPATFSYVRVSEPTAIEPVKVVYPTPFVLPFVSLRAGVPVAQEFEMDDMSAFVTRLRDNIPELAWTGLAETGREIRVAAESLGSPGTLPTPSTIQRTCLSLFRTGPYATFDLWIHVTSASADEADRALRLLEYRVRLVLRSRYTGPYVPLPGNAMTRVLPSDYPPIFHLDFRMEAPPPGLPEDMEVRLNDGTPGVPWKAIVRNGKREGVWLRSEDMHGFQLIYLLPQPEPDRIRVVIDLTAESRERLEVFRQHWIGRIQKLLLNPVRRT